MIHVLSWYLLLYWYFFYFQQNSYIKSSFFIQDEVGISHKKAFITENFFWSHIVKFFHVHKFSIITAQAIYETMKSTVCNDTGNDKATSKVTVITTTTASWSSQHFWMSYLSQLKENSFTEVAVKLSIKLCM